MINVIITRDDAAKTMKMTVSGHSGAQEVGQDLICGAASTLSYTLAQTVKFMYKAGKTKRPTLILNCGSARIRAKAKTDADYAELVHSYFVVQNGFMLLSANFPDKIDLPVLGSPAEEK